MRVSDTSREFLFNQARNVDESLGAIFQNPMEIKPCDIDMELEQLLRIEWENYNRVQEYRQKLTAMRMGFQPS